MTTSQSNKVIFTTGGSTGIGAATVAHLCKIGYAVAFMDSNVEAGNALTAILQDYPVQFIAGNVSSITDIKHAVNTALSKFGKITGLFANAGIYQSKNLLEMTESDWEEVINTNLKGTVFTVKEVLPHMLENRCGSIVLMGSDQCFIGKSRSCAYGMSKAAIAQFTKSTAVDYSRYNIRVNAVCPATIKTPLSEKAIQTWANRSFDGDIEKAWDIEASEHLLGRVGTPEEVAYLVRFLLSDEASFMTGGLYLIDGGLTSK